MTDKKQIAHLVTQIATLFMAVEYIFNLIVKCSNKAMAYSTLVLGAGCIVAIVIIIAGVFVKKNKHRFIGSAFLLLGLFDLVIGGYWALANSALNKAVIWILLIKSVLIVTTGVICLLKPKKHPVFFGTAAAAVILSIAENYIFIETIKARLPSYVHFDRSMMPNNTQDEREWLVLAAGLLLSLYNYVPQEQSEKKSIIKRLNPTLLSAIFSVCNQIAVAALMLTCCNVYTEYNIGGIYIKLSSTGLFFIAITIAETAIYAVTLTLKKQHKFSMKCGNIFVVYFLLHQFFALCAFTEDLDGVGEGFESLGTIAVYILAAAPTIIITIASFITVNLGRCTKETRTLSLVFCIIYCMIMGGTVIAGGASQLLDNPARSIAYLFIIIKYISMGACTGTMLYSTEPENK